MLKVMLGKEATCKMRCLITARHFAEDIGKVQLGGQEGLLQSSTTGLLPAMEPLKK